MGAVVHCVGNVGEAIGLPRFWMAIARSSGETTETVKSLVEVIPVSHNEWFISLSEKGASKEPIN